MSNPRGRPLLLNAQRKQELIHAIQSGATYTMASAYAGISYASFHRWFREGKKEFERRAVLRDEIINLYNHGKRIPKKLIKAYRVRPGERLYFQFFKEVTEANMVAGVGWLQVIDTFAQSSPEWASWMLLKRFPEDFGAGKQQVEITTPPEKPMQVEHHHDGTIAHEHEGVAVDRIAAILAILADNGALDALAETGAETASADGDSALDDVHSDEADG